MPTTLLLDKEEMTRILERLACEVLERHGQCERVMLVGIERRGADLARRLGALMQQKLQRPHDLHMHTLKALKRFWELKDGMRRLLSIILIGQTELRDKLSSTQSDVREVVQRCDVVELPPVKHPGDFLAFRFQRAGSRLEDIFAPDGVEELRNQLVVARGLNAASVYLGYPLAISNFAVASMNLAAELGFETAAGRGGFP